jgi:hypothetical protein
MLRFNLLNAVNDTRTLFNFGSNNIAFVNGVQPSNVPVQDGPVSFVVAIHNKRVLRRDSFPWFQTRGDINQLSSHTRQQLAFQKCNRAEGSIGFWE